MVGKHQLDSERWGQPFFVISSSLRPPPSCIIPQTHLRHHFPCHYFHRFSLLCPSRPLSSRIWSYLEQHRRSPNRRRWQDGGRPVKPQGCEGRGGCVTGREFIGRERQCGNLQQQQRRRPWALKTPLKPLTFHVRGDLTRYAPEHSKNVNTWREIDRCGGDTPAGVMTSTDRKPWMILYIQEN